MLPSIAEIPAFTSIWKLMSLKRDGRQPIWSLDTRKLYTIWISQTPETYMPLINQLRLIRMREANQAAQITLIYDRRCLNAASYQALLKHCHRYHILPIDLMSLMHLTTYSEYDRALWHLANKEIEAMRAHQHGCLASASDYLRVMTSVIRAYGQYFDLDVMINFGKLPARVPLIAPLVLDIKTEGHHALYSLSNDFIGVSTNLLGNLSPQAIIRLKYVQWHMLHLNQHPQKIFEHETPNLFKACLIDYMLMYGGFKSKFRFRAFLKTLTIESYLNILGQYMSHQQDQPNVGLTLQINAFSYREFIYFARTCERSHEDYSIYKFNKIYNPQHSDVMNATRFLERIIMELIIDFTVNLSGPSTFTQLFSIDESQLKNPDADISCQTLNAGQFYFSLEANNINDKVTPDNLLYSSKADSRGRPSNDLSWSETGKKIHNIADNNIKSAAKIICHAFQTYQKAKTEKNKVTAHQKHTLKYIPKAF